MIFPDKTGERAKNGEVLGEEIFCPRADFFFSAAEGGGLPAGGASPRLLFFLSFFQISFLGFMD